MMAVSAPIKSCFIDSENANPCMTFFSLSVQIAESTSQWESDDRCIVDLSIPIPLFFLRSH